jgi:uncharacterized radical SAM superfamily protein
MDKFEKIYKHNCDITLNEILNLIQKRRLIPKEIMEITGKIQIEALLSAFRETKGILPIEEFIKEIKTILEIGNRRILENLKHAIDSE